MSFDVVVLGGGGAGLAAALFASMMGLKPVVIESTEYLGGTTALSAGSVWIPGTPQGLAVNPDDTTARAAAYLAAASGVHGRPDMQRRFLELGPAAVAMLDAGSAVRLRAYPYHPDYLQELEGASLNGRVLEATPFDGRRLGAALGMVRPPIAAFTLFGGMMVDRTDIRHLLGARSSWESARHAAGLVLRHARDRLRGRRSTRMVMGNALIGALLHSLLERKVEIHLRTEVLALRRSDGRVVGVDVRGPGGPATVMAQGGVILAGGGFNRHPGLRGRLIPDVEIFTPGAPGNRGGLIALALELGARLGDEGHGHAFWSPVSVRKETDGTEAIFPHFVLDRAKPGTLVVDQSGRRFLNESTSYTLFARAMIAAHGTRRDMPCFLIADDRALRAYGLGMVRPGGWGARAARRSGYLVSGASLAELAARLGVDAVGLAATAARMNGFSASGVDPEFGRGSTAYQRNLGDPAFSPNPTLGPIVTAPFHAVRLYPGDIGASTGLVTNGDARVLGPDGPIPGLFAVGNDMQSVMAGAYPGPGITLGPAIAFAYGAAQAIATSR